MAPCVGLISMISSMKWLEHLILKISGKQMKMELRIGETAMYEEDGQELIIGIGL